MTNLTADEILVTGGMVTYITPVPGTFDYFVKVGVNPGVASLAIALTPGEGPYCTTVEVCWLLTVLLHDVCLCQD